MNRNLPNARKILFELFVEATRASNDLSEQKNKRAMALGNCLLREAQRLGYSHPEWVTHRIQSHLDEPQSPYWAKEARGSTNDLIAFVGAMTLMDMADKFEWTFPPTSISDVERGELHLTHDPKGVD